MANLPYQQRPSQQQSSTPVVKVLYFKSPGMPDEDLVDKKAEEQAKKLSEAGLEPTQLRHFYGDVTVLQRRIEHEALNTGQSRATVFERLRADFKMLRAKAYYAHGRNRSVFPLEFRDFFERHVFSVSTVEEFDVFCRHFQAVVAFHKFFKEESRRRR